MVGGGGLESFIWMDTFFFLCEEVNRFMIIHFWYAFLSLGFCTECVLMEFHAVVVAFVVLGFTNANWYAQLRYLKVMVTEIAEGLCLIHDRFVQQLVRIFSWYWLAKWYCAKNGICLIVKKRAQCFAFLFASSRSVFQLSNEPVSLQLCLGFSASLHHRWSNTVHNFRTTNANVSQHAQKHSCACQALLPTL